jgi:hypothetical protein
MRRIFIATLFLVSTPLHAQWMQWGNDPQHTGAVAAAAQTPATIFANFLYDPFVTQETQLTGSLLVHYQVPLVDGDDVFMEAKSGTYDFDDWQVQTFNIAALRWTNGALTQQWMTATDWKPAPRGGAFFEPVFHAILANNSIYMPAAGGTILQVDRNSGAVIRRINPFPTLDTTIYVTGPLSSDANGNVVYNTIQFDAAQPWTSDIHGAWLVRVTPAGVTTRATYASLTPAAPKASDACLGVFTTAPPWPPSPTAVPPSLACGSQRPGLNTAPAIASDGTI